ncbi:MAG: DUF1801 domain-containing protein [Pseudomonadota bacterium]
MAELKTKANAGSVADFLATVDDPKKRADCRKVAAMMRRATGKRARLWGSSIVGYGSYHYRYDSGQEGDWMLTGYSPRKQAITVYIMPGFAPFEALLQKLGTYKTGKSCLYIKKLDDVDETVLETLIAKSVQHMRKTYPTA